MDSPSDADVSVPVRTETGHYRRPLLGVPWIAGLVAVPAILALLGGAMGDLGKATPAGSASPGVTTTAVTPSETAGASPGAGQTTLAAALLIVNVDGKTINLAGNVPTTSTRSAYVNALKKSFGSSFSVKDTTIIKAGSFGLDAATFGKLADALKALSGPSLDVKGAAITLTGAAATPDAKNALVSALQEAFSGAQVAADKLVIGDASGTLTDCNLANEYVAAAAASTKIQFASAGSALTPASQAALTKIGEAVKACPIKLVIAGNTDSTGSAAANKKVSLARAEAVKASLVKVGVSDSSIATQGNGSANPIASNDTAAGRTLNRRVDITVG